MAAQTGIKITSDIADFKKGINESKKQTNTLRKEFNEAKKSALSLTNEYRSMSNEMKNSDYGRKVVSQMQAAIKKAGELRDTMDDVNQEIKNVASDTQFADGMKMMASSVGNVSTAVVALTGDSEDMKRVLMDIAKIQATVQAVKSLTEAFQKQNRVLLSNPYVLVASAIAALGVAVYEYTQKANDATEETETFKRAIDNLGSAADVVKYGLTDLFKKAEALANAEIAFEDIKDTEIELNKIDKKLKDLKENGRDALTIKESVIQNKSVAGLTKELEKRQKELQKHQKKQENAIKNYYKDIDAIEEAHKDKDKNKDKDKDKTKSQPVESKVSLENIKAPTFDFADPITKAMHEIQSLTGELKDTAPNTNRWFEIVDALDKANRELDNLLKTSQEHASVIKIDINTAGLEILPQEITDKYLKAVKDLDEKSQKVFWDAVKKGKSYKDAFVEAIMPADVAKKFEDAMKTVGERGKEAFEKAIEEGDYEGAFESLIDKAEQIQNLQEKAKDLAEAAKYIGDFGNAFSSLGKAFEVPALDIMGVIMQAVAQIALAASTAIGQFAGMGPWGWVLGIGTVLPTMLTTIATIKNAVSGYSEGGIIKGPTTIGDYNIIRANAGEMILNTRQQKSLFDMINSGISRPDYSIQNGQVKFKIKGEELVGVLSNTNKKYSRSI